MRRVLALLTTVLLILNMSSAGAIDLTGSKCKKNGQTKVIFEKEYLCVKQGKKLIWKAQAKSSEISRILESQIKTFAPKVSGKFASGVSLISESPSNPRNKPNLDASYKSLQLLRTLRSDMPDYEFYTYETADWINSKMSTACPQIANIKDVGLNAGAQAGCGKLIISNLNGWNNKNGPESSSWFEAGHEAFHLAQTHWANSNIGNYNNWYVSVTDWYREGSANVFGGYISSLMNPGKINYEAAVATERSPFTYRECKGAWDTWQTSNKPEGFGFFKNCEYGLGRRMVELLVAKNGGIEAVLNLYKEVGTGANFETAFEKSHGLSLKAFFVQVETYLDKLGWKG